MHFSSAVFVPTAWAAVISLGVSTGCSVTVVNASAADGGGDDGGSGTAPLVEAAAPPPTTGTQDGGGQAARDARAGVDAAPSQPFVPATPPTWPQVPGAQKVVLKSMKLVTVVSSGDTLASEIFAFADALVASQWWTTVTSEYGVGAPSGSVHVTGPAITQNPDQPTMLSYITSAIASNSAAAQDGSTMYMLFLPKGIVAIDPMNGVNTNCQYFGGFHDQFDSMGDAFGVGQRCPTQGTGLTEIQDLTITGSHEIVEAATDPQPGMGWGFGAVDATQPWTSAPTLTAPGGELADLCLGTQWNEGNVLYQRVWSNQAAAAGGDPCVPAMPGVPYYLSSAPQGWYTVAAGASVDIPFAGFSTSRSNDWVLESTPLGSSSASMTFTATIASTTRITAQGMVFPTTNNGRTATLTVTAPSAASGSWAVFGVASLATSSAAGQDAYHLWPVGVYTP